MDIAFSREMKLIEFDCLSVLAEEQSGAHIAGKASGYLLESPLLGVVELFVLSRLWMDQRLPI